MLTGLLLDIANVLFFLATLPQIVAAYRNRRNLKAISRLMLLGFISGTVLFMTVDILCSAYIAFGLAVVDQAGWVLQVYWKWRYKT